MRDVDKYRATSLQIAGFAMMAPLGNLVVHFLETNPIKAGQLFYLYLSGSILLVFFGIILIMLGDFLLNRGSKNE